MTDTTKLAERIEADDSYLIDYLLGWTGLGEPQPWGAAMSFALEMAHGYGLIAGESDPTPTPLGTSIGKHFAAIRAQEAHNG